MEAATQDPSTEAAPPVRQAAPPPRVRDRYRDEIAPALLEQFGYSSPMEVPRLLKITLNMGISESKGSAALEAAGDQLALIAGQRPSIRRARKSIASFKIREGMPVGVAVTLRKARMWEFLDRLTSIAAPRIRDFRGFSPRSFDGRGNYSLGIREQIIFPEIDYDSIDEVRGLDVTMTTSAATDEEAFELLLALGMPYSQDGRPGEVDTEAEAEEERRRAEARARAEAEAAALEQLKEENPDAYAKRVQDEGPDAEGSKPDGETTDEGDQDASDSADSDPEKKEGQA